MKVILFIVCYYIIRVLARQTYTNISHLLVILAELHMSQMEFNQRIAVCGISIWFCKVLWDILHMC